MGWQFNPTNAKILVSLLDDIEEAIKDSPERGIDLIHLLKFTLSSSININEKIGITNLPDLMKKLGMIEEECH